MYSRKQAYGVNIEPNLDRDCTLINFDRSDKPAEIKYYISQVVDEMKNNKGVPNFSYTATLHVAEVGSEQVVDVKFTIRLKDSDCIQGRNMKQTVTIDYDDNFKGNFIKFLSKWFFEYIKTLMLMKNAYEFTKAIEPLCDEVKIGFVYADVSVVAITDNSIVFGLDEDTIFNLGNSRLFFDNDMLRMLYTVSLRDKFAEFTAPWEVLQCKFPLFNELGIYSRVGVIKRLRKSFKADITDKKKVGVVCKLDFGGCFALVRRLNKADVTDATVVAYEDDTYVYEFVLTPFTKTDNGTFTFIDSDNAKVLLETVLTSA